MSDHRSARWLRNASLSVLAVASPGAALAQAAQPAAAQVQEIIVTANRRAENIQDVPVAVAAVTGARALAGGVTDTQSLANAVPGLTFNRQTSGAIPFLRGVGASIAQPGVEPSIAVYIDDVYSPSSGAAFSNFNSIERIEVEKGPQGTLFGRNATGGVIQIFTKDPTWTPTLDTTAGYANYSTASASLYLNRPLTGVLSANLALYGSHQEEGWGRNPIIGKDAFRINYDYGGRLKLLFEPSEKTRALLGLSYDNTVTSEGYGQPRQGTVGLGLFPALGFYDSQDHTDPHGSNEQARVSLKITHDFDAARFVSISSYTYLLQKQHFDQALSPVPFLNVDARGPDKTSTQEFQLLSPTSSKLTWITGFFFMHNVTGWEPLALAGPAIAPVPSATSTTEMVTNSYSVFAQATASILPATRLTFGLRYTIDNRLITGSFELGDFLSGVAPNSPQNLSQKRFTPKVALDHKFTDDVMGYVSYSKGFKSGTFNSVVFPTAPIDSPVAPEDITAYLLGEKAQFLDRRLQVNAEAFYYDYKNIQLTQQVAGRSILRNAASATIKGVDIDAKVVPISRLTIAAGVEFLHGRYGNFPNGVFYVYDPGCAPSQSNCLLAPPPNLKGFDTINAPPFSLSLQADYQVTTAAGDLDFTIAYNHGGDYFFDVDNGKGQLSQSLDKQPVLNLVNTSVAWYTPDGRYSVRLWARNITGQKYISAQWEDSLSTHYSPAPPATYGFTVSVHM